MTNEEFYDREIAPALLELAGKCQVRGLSLAAVVEWAPGEMGRTVSMREGAGIGFRMTYWAAVANGNADNLIWQMQRHGKEHGHNSVCLAMLEPHDSR